MNVMDLVGYWFFYSDILLVGNCLKKEQWAFWSLNVSLVEFMGNTKLT